MNSFGIPIEFALKIYSGLSKFIDLAFQRKRN